MTPKASSCNHPWVPSRKHKSDMQGNELSAWRERPDRPWTFRCVRPHPFMVPSLMTRLGKMMFADHLCGETTKATRSLSTNDGIRIEDCTKRSISLPATRQIYTSIRWDCRGMQVAPSHSTARKRRRRRRRRNDVLQRKESSVPEKVPVLSK